MAKFDFVVPFKGFTFDTTGIVIPHGKAVMKPVESGSMPLMFNATAVAFDGTPTPAFTTLTWSVLPPAVRPGARS